MTTADGHWSAPAQRLATGAPSAREIVDDAVDAIAPVVGSAIVAAAVPVVPVCLLAAAIPIAPVPLSIAVAVLAVPAVLTGVAAVVRILGDAGLGRTTTATSAVWRARGSVWPLVRLTIRSLPVLVVGLVLFGLGRLALATVVLLLEDVDPPAAWRRTAVLLQGAAGTAAAVLLLGFGLAGAVATGAFALVSVLVPTPDAGSAAVGTLHLVLGIVVGAVLATVALAASAFGLFVSRREQLEALDLQLALRQLPTHSPHSPHSHHEELR